MVIWALEWDCRVEIRDNLFLLEGVSLLWKKALPIRFTRVLQLRLMKELLGTAKKGSCHKDLSSWLS